MRLASGAALLLAAAIGGACVGTAVAQEAACPTCGAPMAKDNADEAPFLAENAAAMDRMMADMAVKPTGDLDRDFVAMMSPHHQGAIDMAVAYLRYGKNPRLMRLAQEIIVTQQQEIAAMRIAIGEAPGAPAPAPTAPGREAAPDASRHRPHMSSVTEPKP
ncbi:DUF305 domain-containing protein [Hansschlegelia zhihuaiae]|uniref:DUF305 domain-containing protein n=1 Tax=Hansschlegelia zhihuaiae TaxID=405005 RepID=A0A4Q0MCR1_9HYPH|nr:DUF305 domain-containing protein [Hansschlegelia zhihuaiae]RXF70883.1 DUF305 domain-containing protein [Hansschlegelia zhihuaiae]